ncbi:MAG: DUF7487 domain-containing protein [Nitrosopumilaceae archaeon]
MTLKKTHQDFLLAIQEHNTAHPDKRVYLGDNQVYDGSYIKLLFNCEQKHQWWVSPTQLISFHNGCPKCGIKLQQQNMLQKYGAKHTFQIPQFYEKRKKTMIARYGVEFTNQSDILRKKQHQTMSNRYGVTVPLQSAVIREKMYQANIEKYGVMHVCQLPAIREKTKQTFFKKYEREHHMQKHITLDNMSKLQNYNWLIEQHHVFKKSPSLIAYELNVTTAHIIRLLAMHDIKQKHYHNSIDQIQLISFLEENNIDCKVNNRSLIPPLEVDIFIPEKHLAIEYNGLFWHSELRGIDRYYHLNKTNACRKKNIQLIHIFGCEWYEKPEIVKSRIKSILGLNERIFARKCNIITLSNKTATLFYEENHIQGSCGAHIHLGLIHKNQLVATMSFGKSRYNKRTQWELIRYSNKVNTNIVGGASKLFKQFITQHSPQSIISYSDKRWNTGNMYLKLNFGYSHASKPNYWYFNAQEYVLHSRIKFQKHKLEKQLEMFDPNLTEWENMINNGWNRIWDCGNDVWIWNKNK